MNENKLPVEALILPALQYNPVGISLNMSLLTVGNGLKGKEHLDAEGDRNMK